MKSTSFIAASVLALAASPAFAAGHAGTSGYALANDGATLLMMPSIAAPGDLKTFSLETSIDAIAYRPVTGQLIGFTNGAIYEIDTSNGALTDLDAKFMGDATTSGMVAFDFNNKIDAVRAVSSAGDNLVYFPDGFGGGDEKQNSVRRFTSLEYAAGDLNAGAKAAIFANAYTNAINGAKAGSTFQYALDANTNSLVSLANNKGTLETIATVTIDGAAADLAMGGGFDIVSPAEGSDAAYAILQLEGEDTAGLYALDVKTGAATLLSDLGVGGISSFAVSAQ